MNQIRRNQLFKQVIVIILCLIFLYHYKPSFRKSLEFIIQGAVNIYNQVKFISTLSEPRLNEQLYQSLFAQNKQVRVQIKFAHIYPQGPNRQFINYNISYLKRLYKGQILNPSNQFITLREFNQTVFVHEEFAKINKENLTFVVPVQVTESMLDEWNQWQVCVIVSFYTIFQGKQYQILTEYFPTLKQWRANDFSRMDLIFNADPDLIKSSYKTKIINNVEIYLFEATQSLAFNQPFERDPILFFQRPRSKKYYYFFKPIGTSINTLIQSNYVPYEDLQVNQTFRTRFTIKIKPAYFFKFLYFQERYTQLYHKQIQSNQKKQITNQNWYFGQGWLSLFSSQDQQSLWIKYVKQIAFKGSVPLLIFLGIQFVLFVFYHINTYSTYIADYFIFRNASRYRGMSLYSLLLNFFTSFLMLVVQYLYFQQGDFLFLVGLVAFIFWQLNKVINFEYSFLFPFVKCRKTDWYKNYSKQDQKAFLIVLGPLLAFFSIYTFYPLLFQSYLTSYKHYQMKYTLAQYLIKRLVFGLQTYYFVFSLSIQIVLNYLTKSCNSIPWVWITVALMVEMTNNVSVPVMDSNVQGMLYLKEDFCIVVIILQKLCYKGNLPLGQIDGYLKPDLNEDNSQIEFSRAKVIKKEVVLRQQEDSTLRHNVFEDETTDILEQMMRTRSDNPNNIIIHEFEENKGMTRKED